MQQNTKLKILGKTDRLETAIEDILADDRSYYNSSMHTIFAVDDIIYVIRERTIISNQMSATGSYYTTAEFTGRLFELDPLTHKISRELVALEGGSDLPNFLRRNKDFLDALAQVMPKDEFAELLLGGTD